MKFNPTSSFFAIVVIFFRQFISQDILREVKRCASVEDPFIAVTGSNDSSDFIPAVDAVTPVGSRQFQHNCCIRQIATI